ncbi:MAG: hypothetical protein ABI406_02955 [Ktedonobacteraceae bacterium]
MIQQMQISRVVPRVHENIAQTGYLRSSNTVLDIFTDHNGICTAATSIERKA